MNASVMNQFGGLAVAFALLYWLATIVVNVLFSIAVLLDAGSIRRAGSPPFLVGSAVWALATLFGGVFVAGLYWVIHHSALQRAGGVTEFVGTGDDRTEPARTGATEPEPEEVDAPTWRCPSCGESVPETFEMCWKCKAQRP